ncbi:hypothetical protein E1287_29130 [Actinomadura sp. KC06]|uniref:hypothetical protein n=1 Tax=Actinomadura sp. KC06 TaxID=2530369 RepID=UPI00105119EA|nr:hypothetical protein [Actinomadura sp. KC06]TDD30544.1 hypothetical protein E1287_29130 [Actinomadura sp. KC06]
MAAWKGRGDDQRLWWCQDGGSRRDQELVSSGAASSSHGPALAMFQNNVVAAFTGYRGPTDDPRIFMASFDRQSMVWAGPEPVKNGTFLTSHSPALAVHKRSRKLAWKGWKDDQRLWLSSYDGSTWTEQQESPGQEFLTNHGPSLGVQKDEPFLVWLRPDGQKVLCASSGNGAAWSTPKPLAVSTKHVPGVGTTA